jgi:hypothetical protein
MMVLLLAFFGPVTLAQQARSFSFELLADVSHATPLFGPVREREWAPEWAPQFLHPATPTQREGAIFTTTGHGGTRLWILTAYDPAAGRVGYLVTDPGFLVTEITISIVPAGARASRATVTYRRSALTERANEQVRAMTSDWAAEQAHHWGTAIGAALKRTASVAQ